MVAKSLMLAVAAAFLLSATAQATQSPAHNPRHKVLHRKHVRKSSPPYGAMTPSVLSAPPVYTPAPSVVTPLPPPAQEARPALITPGAPAYGPGILVPGPPGTVPMCAPLSRSQGLC